MHRVLLLGAGKIGRMIARFLSETKDFHVVVADSDDEARERIVGQSSVEAIPIDASDRAQLKAAMLDFDSVVSALSFRFNPNVAQAALESGTS